MMEMERIASEHPRRTQIPQCRETDRLGLRRPNEDVRSSVRFSLDQQIASEVEELRCPPVTDFGQTLRLETRVGDDSESVEITNGRRSDDYLIAGLPVRLDSTISPRRLGGADEIE